MARTQDRLLDHTTHPPRPLSDLANLAACYALDTEMRREDIERENASGWELTKTRDADRGEYTLYEGVHFSDNQLDGIISAVEHFRRAHPGDYRVWYSG